MVSYQTPNGSVRIADSYFAKLIGEAVSSCYGVAQMVPKGTQWLRQILKLQKSSDTGITVRGDEHNLYVDLHIAVMHGMNMSAISRSIVNKVTYVVEETTGIKVKKVTVHIDRMIAD